MSAVTFHHDSELIEQRGWIDQMIHRAPRLSLIALIAMGWALTLAWPPVKNTGPLVEGGLGEADMGIYPLRLALPDPGGTVSLERLVALAEAHPAIKALDLLPEPEAEEPGVSAQLAESSASQPASQNASGRDFSSAFADFTASLPASRRSDARAAAALAAAEGLEPGSFLKLNYDLATLAPSQPASGGKGGPASYNAADGSLTVTKPLLVNGQSKGKATIRIEEGAQIFIATAAVAEALGERAQALPSRIATALETGSGFIPFHELRGAGVAVEYDPVNDRVSLSMPS